MIIYPAIDLIDGAVVRLHKGKFDQLTTYATDPVFVAQSYANAGATWLHLVDLNGAKNPENRQISLISKIIENTGLNVQTGGGIRSFDEVKTLIKVGARRVVDAECDGRREQRLLGDAATDAAAVQHKIRRSRLR